MSTISLVFIFDLCARLGYSSFFGRSANLTRSEAKEASLRPLATDTQRHKSQKQPQMKLAVALLLAPAAAYVPLRPTTQRASTMVRAEEPEKMDLDLGEMFELCLLYTSPSPRD